MMSAISSPSQTISTGDGKAVSPVTSLEIDASCRVPVLFLFLGALTWLLLGSILGLIASLKFHAPNLLADCAWFTYGRVHPANLNALVYGFAAQAGLGVVLWIAAHLGRTRLAMGPAIIAGAALWNLAIFMGIVGILYGESTGFEWLEMPRYASATLFCGYLLIAVAAVLTLHQRTQREFYISQWFILAALFWFPWIYTTASLTLVVNPVRGVLQTAIDCWYANNLTTVWFGFIGLAAIFYFVPKVVKRPLYSHYMGVFAFGLLVLFGSWGNVPVGTPLPSWISALSTMGALITVVPILSAGMNVAGTMCGNSAKMSESRPLKFFVFATAIYVAAGLASAATSVSFVSKVTNFTWFMPANTQLFLYGFVAMTLFGSMYYIVPRLVGGEFPAQGMICLQFLLSGGGLLIYAVPLAIGGILQGLALNNPDKAFADISKSTVMFFRISTLGELMMLVGNLMILLNVIGLLTKVGRQFATVTYMESVKAMEVIW